MYQSVTIILELSANRTASVPRQIIFPDVSINTKNYVRIGVLEKQDVQISILFYFSRFHGGISGS
jgi:hypothetical protein